MNLKFDQVMFNGLVLTWERNFEIFTERLLKFLVNFTLLKYVKSQRSYGFPITNELIFGFQILDLKDHFSASLNTFLGSQTSLRVFIGVETAALTFRTKQYSTSYSSHIWYDKRFYNDFFLNHNTIALVRNCLKLVICVVIKTALH